MMNALPG
ncbi:Protein of unknown function [Thermobacillus xylanilyticus]|nr:Protein of unknown function [Thermobacillus xylanilyticus]